MLHYFEAQTFCDLRCLIRSIHHRQCLSDTQVYRFIYSTQLSPIHPIHTCHQMWKKNNVMRKFWFMTFAAQPFLLDNAVTQETTGEGVSFPREWAQVRKTLTYSNGVFYVVHVGKSLEKWIFFFKSSIRWKFSSKVKLVKMFFSLRYESSTLILYKELSNTN